jgi:hypothetical protein
MLMEFGHMDVRASSATSSGGPVASRRHFALAFLLISHTHTNAIRLRRLGAAIRSQTCRYQ